MDRHFEIRKLVYTALLTAIIEAAKWALNAIANVELVSLLTMIFTIYFGWQITLCSLLLFALIECLWWGVSIWTVTYFYVWPLLILVTWLFRDKMDRYTAALISGFFGLSFGALCSLTTLVMSGPEAAFAWWIAGIPYDVVHGISNCIIAFILYEPLIRALKRMNIRL